MIDLLNEESNRDEVTANAPKQNSFWEHGWFCSSSRCFYSGNRFLVHFLSYYKELHGQLRLATEVRRCGLAIVKKQFRAGR